MWNCKFKLFDSNSIQQNCYYKNYKIKYYFDSYENITVLPFKELIKYVGKENILFNNNQFKIINIHLFASMF